MWYYMFKMCFFKLSPTGYTYWAIGSVSLALTFYRINTTFGKIQVVAGWFASLVYLLLRATLFKNGNVLCRVFLRQAMPVPYTGSQSPFLQGSYTLGKDGYVLTYKTFVEDFKPRLAADTCVGAFYADILHGFAGKCEAIKMKNNQKWPLVKSVQSKRQRAINPR